MMGNPVFVAPWHPVYGAAPVQLIKGSTLAQLEATDSVAGPNYNAVFLVAQADVGALRTALYAYDPVGAANVQLKATAGGALEVFMTAGGATGASAVGSVGAASALLKAANANAKWLTIQNTHLTATLYLSFASPATTNDIKLVAGASITMETAPVNAIYGIGSIAGTTFAIMELS